MSLLWKWHWRVELWASAVFLWWVNSIFWGDIFYEAHVPSLSRMWVTLCIAISSLVGMGGERFGSQRLPDVYWEQVCCLPFLTGVLLEWWFRICSSLWSFLLRRTNACPLRLKSRMLVLRCPHPHLDLGGPMPCVCRLFFWSSLDGKRHTPNQHSCLNHPLQPFWHWLFAFEFISSCLEN